MGESPAIAYSVAGGVLLLVVIWGPTSAFRNIWWILVFAALVALGVTILRHETALEFPGTQHGQALQDFQAQQAEAPDHKAASRPPTATSTLSGDFDELTVALASSSARVETLERLAGLRDRGAITNDEYQAEKTHVMHNGA